MFRRILIANRGEIALRVVRTAREMGVESVAVFSDFDRTSLHARMAELSIRLPGTSAVETYLNVERILDAARETGAEAIHPGYGFLAENAAFAREVERAGLVWIGPPPGAIEAMGDKIESRRHMIESGVPVVPGLAEPLESAREARDAADELGWPVALKAAAGGGGKGIRIVREPAEMEAAFRAASGEAAAAFGDRRVYLERFLERPRHIEIQLLFDAHGGAVHLGERECSVQRRHQKLIEESPSPVVSPEMREEMGAVALRAGRAVGYRSAGTVEFLWTDAGGSPEFFFLEMNTRLQVEHAVTEMVTGIDLVREQLRIAAGEPLGYAQEDVRLAGHSIEVRINAEDPTAGFLPSTGTVRNLRLPGGPWVRIDSALYRGMEVGLVYDPMLAKIIVWGPDREAAIRRMHRALQELNVGGIRTGAPAALRVLEDEAFRSGVFDTSLLERMDLAFSGSGEEEAAVIAAAIHRWTSSKRQALERRRDRAGWLARARGQRSHYPPADGRPERPRGGGGA